MFTCLEHSTAPGQIGNECRERVKKYNTAKFQSWVLRPYVESKRLSCILFGNSEDILSVK